MQACDVRSEYSLLNPRTPPDLPAAMSDGAASPIRNSHESPSASGDEEESESARGKAMEVNSPAVVAVSRIQRPPRACTTRAAARLYGSSPQQVSKAKQHAVKKEEDELQDGLHQQQCSGGGPASRVVSQLVSSSPEPSQLPRWNLRGMWELASVLNFLHVFRHLLNINIEFSAEEFETALLSPNDTLSDIHIPLLKAIPPITRMALGRKTWVTVLCRKLRDWWHWVADGDIPIVASHGAETDVYRGLEPGVRVLILKALCDIRVEQEDIRSYIDLSIKRGVHLSAFRKERVGGDSYGISYWYEDDPIIGHRLYRETRKNELKKARIKGSHVLPSTTYQWETVATNFDEFQDVAGILFSSKNRTEISLGKKLKNDMLPEIEKVHKRKEKLLKKQHREALLLDNSISLEGLGPGRSLRDRKPVTYTFDDFDRSINDAIKVTKHGQPVSEPHVRREGLRNSDAVTNGKWAGPSQSPEPEGITFSALSPKSMEEDEFDDDQRMDLPDRSNRKRQRPQRYSGTEFIDTVSDNEVDFDSDDDIVGEAIYDEEYLRSRKQRRRNRSSSEGDDEYQGEEENAEDEEEEEEDFLNASEESDGDEPPRFRKLPSRTRRERERERDTKFRPLLDFQTGLRRSSRATRTRINYRQIELSDSDTELAKSKKPRSSDAGFSEPDNMEYSGGSPGFEPNNDVYDDQEEEEETDVIDHGHDDQKEVDEADQIHYDHSPMPAEDEEEENQPRPRPDKSPCPAQDEAAGNNKRGFLDLNQLAPASLDDSPNRVMKDDDTDHF
uniref:DDT domain-containing protein n=3 Tax=Kalanchoe fedtschenkoi TaxID=63787 RepID=A0A7N0VMQ0_KALFE